MSLEILTEKDTNIINKKSSVFRWQQKKMYKWRLILSHHTKKERWNSTNIWLNQMLYYMKHLSSNGREETYSGFKKRKKNQYDTCF